MEEKNVFLSSPLAGEDVRRTGEGYIKENTYLIPLIGFECLRTQNHFPRQGGSQTASGFTLIELLVVVLIIGILAAVALPKYELAVAKARYMQLISLASALRKGQDLYKLANGQSTDDISVLSIDLPKGTQVVNNKVSYSWGSCSIGTTGYATCESTRDGVSYTDLGSTRQCTVIPGLKEEFGKKICKSLGADSAYTDTYGRFVYNFR